MIAIRSVSEQLKTRTRSFLKAFQERDFDKVWHHQITQEAANLLAATLFIMHSYKHNEITEILSLPSKFSDLQMSILDGFSYAFHEDVANMRTSFFEGMASQFGEMGWYRPHFSSQSCRVFTDTFGEKPTAVLIAETSSSPLILPFVKDNNTYKIDFEVLILFSMFVTASDLYEIGIKSIELKNEMMAIALFELISYLETPYQRLRRIFVKHPFAQKMVTPKRKGEIEGQDSYFSKARNQIIQLSSPKPDFLNTGNFRALLVGVNAYDDLGIPSLSVCTNDACVLHQTLIGSYDIVRLLTDTTDNGLPTRANILTELENIAQSVNDNDLLLFYFSGHGATANGESYLLPRDARSSALRFTGVAMKEVGEILRNCPARAKVMIIDSCHSGASIGKSENLMTLEFLERVFKEAEGTAVLASCKQEQRSFVWEEKQLSVYTYYLTDAIIGKADTENKGFVTVSDVNRYVTNNVKSWSLQNGLLQTPTLQYTVVGDIVLNQYLSRS